jgi:hypothetical protein
MQVCLKIIKKMHWQLIKKKKKKDKIKKKIIIQKNKKNNNYKPKKYLNMLGSIL